MGNNQSESAPKPKKWSDENIAIGERTIYDSLRMQNFIRDPASYMAEARSLFEVFLNFTVENTTPSSDRVFAWLQNGPMPIDTYEHIYRPAIPGPSLDEPGVALAPVGHMEPDHGAARRVFEEKCEVLTDALVPIQTIVAAHPDIEAFLGYLTAAEFVRVGGKDPDRNERDSLPPIEEQEWKSEPWHTDLLNSIAEIKVPFVEMEAFIQAASPFCTAQALQVDLARVRTVLSHELPMVITITLQSEYASLLADVTTTAMVHDTVQENLMLESTPEVFFGGEALQPGSTFADHGIQDGAQLVVFPKLELLDGPQQMSTHAVDMLHQFVHIFDSDGDGALTRHESLLFFCVMYETALQKVQEGAGYDTAVGPILLFCLPIVFIIQKDCLDGEVVSVAAFIDRWKALVDGQMDAEVLAASDITERFMAFMEIVQETIDNSKAVEERLQMLKSLPEIEKEARVKTLFNAAMQEAHQDLCCIL